MRGNLPGRAVQAVVLDQVDASPVQVEAADRLLAEQPLETPLLFTTVDPAARPVWPPTRRGISPPEVFCYADDIKAVSVQVPGLVVAAVLGEQAPHRAR